MSKSQLRLKPHSVLPDQQVVEIWYEGRFIGQVTGADGPGVRVISKYEMDMVPDVTPPIEINCAEVMIKCQ